MALHAHQTKAEWDKVLSQKTLVYARDTEFENANKANARFYHHLERYFRETVGLEPDENECHSLYLDTREFDLLREGQCSLRDRPSGTTSQGEEFADQIGLKYVHDEFQRAAQLITHHFYHEKDFMRLPLDPKDRMRFFPRVRQEIEREHKCPQNLGEYRFSDLPLLTRHALKERLFGTRCENMVFVPLFKTMAHRTRFLVFLNARESVPDSELILPAKSMDEAKKFTSQWMAMEVGFDQCEYAEGKPGMTIAQILEAPQNKLIDLGRHRDDKWIIEHEYKRGQSRNLTDGSLIKTYMRFMMFMYEEAIPFVREGERHPFRPAGSKLARGVKAKLTRDEAFEMIGSLWVYAP